MALMRWMQLPDRLDGGRIVPKRTKRAPMHLSSDRLAQIFSAIGHFYMHLFTAFFFVIVLAIEADWRLPYHDLVELWTLGALLVGAGALPAGWLGDRWSARGMMAVFFIGIGLSAILCGFAKTPTMLLIGLAGIGLFASIYHPVGIAWLVRNAHSRGKALGLNGIFGTAGVAGAGLIAGALIDLASWRVAFILPGLVSVLTGVVFLGLVRAGRIVDGGPTRPKEPPASRDEMLRGFGVLVLGMFCGGLIYQATQAALPKLFAERLAGVLGDGALGVGVLVAFVYGVAGLMQYLGGHLADRYPLKRLYVLSFLVQGPLLFGLAGMTGLPVVATATVAVLLGIGVLPAENMMLARFAPERHRSLAFAAKFVISFGTAPLALVIISRINEATGGFYWLFVLLAALAALVFAAALLLPGDRRPAPAPQPAE